MLMQKWEKQTQVFFNSRRLKVHTCSSWKASSTCSICKDENWQFFHHQWTHHMLMTIFFNAFFFFDFERKDWSLGMTLVTMDFRDKKQIASHGVFCGLMSKHTWKTRPTVVVKMKLSALGMRQKWDGIWERFKKISNLHCLCLPEWHMVMEWQRSNPCRIAQTHNWSWPSLMKLPVVVWHVGLSHGLMQSTCKNMPCLSNSWNATFFWTHAKELLMNHIHDCLHNLLQGSECEKTTHTNFNIVHAYKIGNVSWTLNCSLTVWFLAALFFFFFQNTMVRHSET